MVNHAWTMSFALGCSVLLWWADDGAQFWVPDSVTPRNLDDHACKCVKQSF